MKAPATLYVPTIPTSSPPRVRNASCFGGSLMGSDGGKYTVAGGTSFAAPIFAGFVALINQAENATGQGNINPELYSLAADPSTYASAFHDITSGSNACVSGAANCTAAGQSGYAAASGYDEATGLGSIDFNALLAAWPTGASAGLQSTVIALSAPATSASTGQTVPIQINVEPFSQAVGATTPTGNVSVSVDAVVAEATLSLSPDTTSTNAVASYNFVAPATAGSHLVTVNYPGDATHSAATATYSVLVGNVQATGGITLSAGNLTLANNASGSTQVTITPSGGYYGRLVWSLSATGTGSAPLSGCYAIPSLLVAGATTTVNLAIGVGTACKSALPANHADFRVSGQHARANTDLPLRHRLPVYACLLICGCLAGLRGKGKRLSSLLLLVLLLPVICTILIACGGGGSSSSGGSSSTTTTPTPPSTYQLTLSGTDSVNGGVVNASTTFTLTVNN